MFVKFKYSIIEFICAFNEVLNKFFVALLCYIIPINKNKIVFSSFEGSWIGCNPKYILKEIVAQNMPYELVWLNKKDENPEFKNVKFVDYKDKISVLKELASAKIWIDNSLKTQEFKRGLIKKKNQFYINTWHGSFGIKKLFYDTEKYSPNKTFEKFLKKDFDSCDLMFSNCEWEENVFKSAMRYNGVIKKIGHPRNDIFFKTNEEYKNKISEIYGVPKNQKIALYMPSYRNSLADLYYDIDFKKLKDSLENRFGGNWVVLARCHNFNLKNKMFDNSNVINVSSYNDSQELLCVADVLISDYSSCMFDFILTKKPCFVYAKDINEYEIERGLYYNFNKTPFLLAKNNEELFENILNFNHNEYEIKCIEFLKEKDATEDGLASKRAVEIIKKIMVKNEI